VRTDATQSSSFRASSYALFVLPADTAPARRALSERVDLMPWVGMRRVHHHNAWVAAFLAMVLKLMALPMASAFGTLSLEQLLAGSFCSSGGVQQVALALDKDEPASPAQSDQYHCCCSQSVGAAPIPVQAFAVPDFIAVAQALPTEPWCRVSPRSRWPSINPRASPARCA